MIQRQLKLKLTKTQEKKLEQWLYNLTGVYNWAIRKIKLNADNRIYFSKFDLKRRNRKSVRLKPVNGLSSPSLDSKKSPRGSR